MNNRLKFLFGALLLLTTTIPLAGTYRTKAQLKSTSASLNQAQDRIVSTKADFNPPVTIMAIKTKEGEIKTDKKFLANDDWLQGLKIRVANQSGKTVTFVGIELLFRRTSDQEAGIPAGWPFEYGLDPFDFEEEPAPLPQFQAISPGRDLEIELSDREYEEVRSFLREVQFPSVKKIELRVIKIGFGDGTAWNAGYLFRREPNSIQGPLKGWV